jgi:hypothetical protein
MSLAEDFTAEELRTLLLLARAWPTPASPLAGIRPAGEINPVTFHALRAKGVCDFSGVISGEWRFLLATALDPSCRITINLEGALQFLVGTGGSVATLTPQANGTMRLSGMLLTSAILRMLDARLGLGTLSADHQVAPLADLTIEEMTTFAALADANREEQLRALAERRPAITGHASRAGTMHQLTQGLSNRSQEWLVAILAKCAPPFYAPSEEHLDKGAGSLVARGWARPGTDSLEFGPQLESLCDVFSSLSPFLAITIGAPEAQAGTAIFIRGSHHCTGIGFRGDGAGRRWVSLRRLGAPAMSEALSLLLSPLDAPATVAPPPVLSPVSRPVSSAQPAAPPLLPPQPQPVACRKCGAPLAPNKPFCTKCGAPVQGPRA